VSSPLPRLVIFDCDGVLVDSERISIAVLVEIINAAGGSISEEAALLRFLGMSMASVGTMLKSDFGFAVTADHIEAMRRETLRRFAQELRPIPGVAAVLRGMTSARCVASSSGLDRIRLSLKVTGLLELLEPHLYSASMVARGKPEPDLFLHAASSMGVAPEHCTVIEDSPAGVAAAKRAGMRVLAFVGGSHATQANLHKVLASLSPDAIFKDMSELPALLAHAEPRVKAS